MLLILLMLLKIKTILNNLHMKYKYILVTILIIITSCKSHRIYTEQELKNIKKTASLRNEMMNDYENDQREFNEDLNNQN